MDAWKESPMANSSISSTHYGVTRFTIDVGSTAPDFRSKYEEAVPPVPVDQVNDLVMQRSPWQEMRELIDSVAPFGLLIYGMIDAEPLMRLAGDDGSCVTYLMGNQTIAEQMFRYEPSVMLYAPLHTAIWSASDGAAHFTFDKPSDQFGSFANPAVATVGVELDRKVAALLDHLEVAVPEALLSS
jgi:Domain of unknown function DUF302